MQQIAPVHAVQYISIPHTLHSADCKHRVSPFIICNSASKPPISRIFSRLFCTAKTHALTRSESHEPLPENWEVKKIAVALSIHILPIPVASYFSAPHPPTHPLTYARFRRPAHT